MILLASVAMPAVVRAQPRETVERRVDRLESQLRAVQRRVFPNGNVEPEVAPQGPALPGGLPGGDAITSLTQRVDALETQLRALTGQVEENGHRTQELADQLARLRTELGARLDRVDPPQSAAPAPRTEPRAEPPAETPDEPPPARSSEPAAPTVPGTAEEAYNAGFRLWDQRRYGEAQTMLEAAAARYPSGRWNSWTRNLLGRSYLDDNKPATAARILLANYNDNRDGDRAADSLFYLGDALTRLNRRTEACRVYDELVRVYPTARDQIRSQLPQARRAARCAAN